MASSLRLGSLELPSQVVIAPIAGYTDYAFRTMIRRFTSALMFAEMVSVRALVQGSEKSLRRLQKAPNHHPLGVQLFGGEPKYFSEAAKMVEQAGVDVVDINFGCPKVPGEQLAGSRLLRHPQLVRQIIRAVRKATDLPFTVKIRAGYSLSSLNYREIVQIAQEEGVDGLTIHGRTCQQRFSGRCNWDWIREAVEVATIPIIANGDVRSPEDAKGILEYTGAQGVMIGRAGLGRPWLIRDVERFLAGLPPLGEPSPEEMGQLLLDHLEVARLHLGEGYLRQYMRRIVSMYFKAVPGVKELRRQIHEASHYEEVKRLIREFAKSQYLPKKECTL